ncbi:MAG: nitrate reductase, partial [Rhizobiales bacterium 32-66-8]
MASSVAGHKRAFGSDTVPGAYEDLDSADLIVLTGSNTAWCHPVLFRRMEAARTQRGTKLVVIDPRRTATAEDADLFLPLAPGTDTALFSGLLVHLADCGALDAGFIDQHTAGFSEALAAARTAAPSLAATARATGLPEAEVAHFFALFRDTARTVTCYSQGVNQAAQGTDKVSAILNCHLATGRIGKPGMGPFSLTGQPNAMGGREVGGLANQLAAHMGFSPDEVDRVRRFWSAPAMATREGLKAVDMFAAIGRGEIKALWVMGTNPAVSLPQADAVRTALARLDTFVVSETVRDNDTTRCRPHVLLPAAAWGEKDGTVTNSERRISRQRPFLPLPGQAKPNWWALAQVARRLGHGAGFAWNGPAEIFREHAALSAFENGGTRDFDLTGLADLRDPDYEALAPVQWPVRDAPAVQASAGTARLFADGGFFTPDWRARFMVPAPLAPSRQDADFPLLLNTGRVRDQWHTMTRTGLSPRLGSHSPTPVLAVHPQDAARCGLAVDGFATIRSATGTAVLPVRLDPGQQEGTVFAPIHWSDATASHARIGALVHAVCDPFSGQPDAKATPVALAPHAAPLRGFLLSRTRRTPPPDLWWARARLDDGFGWTLAAPAGTEKLMTWARAQGTEDLAEFHDAAGGQYRAAGFDADGALAYALLLGPQGTVPSWDALKSLLGEPGLTAGERRGVLSGQRAGADADAGPLVCACFGVSAGAITAAITAGDSTAAAIGARLKAGTNCGSCLPEITQLLARTRAVPVEA